MTGDQSGHAPADADGRWRVRTMAIVFVDCSAAWADLPDRAARQEALVAAAGELGAEHVEPLGDGVMVTFASLRPAVALVDRVTGREPRRWRIGLHVGDVSTSIDGRVFGVAVHLAARLYQHCEPGEVLATHSARLLGDPERFGGERPIEAKGFAEPITAVTFVA